MLTAVLERPNMVLKAYTCLEGIGQVLTELRLVLFPPRMGPSMQMDLFTSIWFHNPNGAHIRVPQCSLYLYPFSEWEYLQNCGRYGVDADVVVQNAVGRPTGWPANHS